MIIGLAGFAGAGKSTAADFFEAHGFVRDAYAKTMKEAVSVMFGVPLEILQGDIAVKSSIDPYWAMTYRQILQLFGTEACRHTFGEDIWERVLWRRHDKPIRHNPFYNLVIEDVRFANEAEAVLKRGGKVIKIVRRGYEGDHHASERGLPLTLVTHIIYNDGDKADLFVKLLNLL